MKTCLLPALAAVLLLVACKKETADPDGLVPATQEGKNTGDFLLNGVPWGPKASITSTGNPVGARWDKIRGGREVTLIFVRYGQNDEVIANVRLPYITQPGIFTLADVVNPFIVAGSGKAYMSYAIFHPSPARRYLTGPTYLGRVEVTRYDTVARVVSGTFEAKLREYQGPDSVSITKGRFDCKF